MPLFERPAPLYPRGPWLRIELCCLVPSRLTTTPSASPAGTLRLRFTLYAAPSLCGSASATRGTFPTFAAVLSLHVADPTPAVRRAIPLCSHGDSRLPPPIMESPPTIPSLPAISDGLFYFGAASFALCYDLHVCLALLTGYDEMKSRALHPAF
jgi:hypothetical protein